MDTVLIVARALLVLVFAVAGLAKLADRAGSRVALEGFGVPGRIARPGAVILPIAELATAALLVPSSTARIGAVLASVLLVGFGAGIGRALARGQAPDCHCFGQLHSRPAGSETLARNGALLVVGLLLVVDPGPSLNAWASASSGDRIAAAAFALVTIVLAYAYASLAAEMRGTHGASAQTTQSLDIGASAPTVQVKTLTGDPVAIPDLMSGHVPSVLVFTSATCGPCVGLLPELARWRQVLKGRLDVQVIAAGDEESNRELAEEHGLDVFLDASGRASAAHGVTATPSAIDFDRGGRVAGNPVAGAPAIEALIRTVLAGRAKEPLHVHQVDAVA